MSARTSKFLFLLLILVFLPEIVGAQIVINEVQLSPTGERFVELYNTGSSAVDLTDWFIQRKTATGSSFGSFVSGPNFADKTIPALGYFVISRSSLESSDIVLSTLTLTESNTIQIKNSNGEIVDKVGWGNSSDCTSPCPSNPPSGESIQKTASGWVTASPTPGAVNSLLATTSSGGSSTSTSTESQSTTTMSSSSSSDSDSTHYSAAWLSSARETGKLEVGAGRDRTSTVGTPVQFSAEVNFGYAKNNYFQWSLGDGTVRYGPVVTHTYSYPGEYVVVLNVSLSEDRVAVSRVNVRIFAPGLSITFASPERVEVANSGKSEANLYGRALVTSRGLFAFPQDTIIKPGQKISFSRAVTGLSPAGLGSVELLVVGTQFNPYEMIAEFKKEKQEAASLVSAEIEALQGTLAQKYRELPPAEVLATGDAPEPAGAERETVVEESAPQTALALDAISASTSSRLTNWLAVLKQFFLKTK